MYYVIKAADRPQSLEQRGTTGPDHLRRLQVLQQQGRLLLAGPLPAIDSEDPGPAGFTGSLIVAEFDSLDAAKDWAQADPYVTAGVYESVTVEPFRKVLP